MNNKLISLVLITALSFQCFIKLGVIGYYNLNIEYIIKELCENKNKPELKCNGKCFLKKKMSEADKTEKESKVVIKQVEFQVIIPQSQLLLNAEYIVFENPLREITDLYSHNLNTRIFHPPLI
jgi:hypothetical protein